MSRLKYSIGPILQDAIARKERWAEARRLFVSYMAYKIDEWFFDAFTKREG